ncbi:hypothetical protein RUND412_010963, partial [Rhizina undulata]
ISTLVYLKNRSPTSALLDKTPAASVLRLIGTPGSSSLVADSATELIDSARESGPLNASVGDGIVAIRELVEDYEDFDPVSEQLHQEISNFDNIENGGGTRNENGSRGLENQDQGYGQVEFRIPGAFNPVETITATAASSRPKRNSAGIISPRFSTQVFPPARRHSGIREQPRKDQGIEDRTEVRGVAGRSLGLAEMVSREGGSRTGEDELDRHGRAMLASESSKILEPRTYDEAISGPHTKE